MNLFVLHSSQTDKVNGYSYSHLVGMYERLTDAIKARDQYISQLESQLDNFEASKLMDEDPSTIVSDGGITAPKWYKYENSNVSIRMTLESRAVGRSSFYSWI